MSGLAISIVGNDTGVRRMLEVLDTALNPIAIAGFLGATVDPYLKKRAEARFANEGDDVVGAWAPLKESTQSIREQMGYGASHPINRRSGDLENYITKTQSAVMVDPGGALLTFPGNPPFNSELKDKVETAQRGSADPRTVPRPVIGLNENDMVFVLTSLAYYIQSSGKALL